MFRIGGNWTLTLAPWKVMMWGVKNQKSKQSDSPLLEKLLGFLLQLGECYSGFAQKFFWICEMLVNNKYFRSSHEMILKYWKEMPKIPSKGFLSGKLQFFSNLILNYFLGFLGANCLKIIKEFCYEKQT